MVFNRSINIKSQFEKRQGISFRKFLSVAKSTFSTASGLKWMMNTLGMLNVVAKHLRLMVKTPHDTNSEEINRSDRMKQ